MAGQPGKASAAITAGICFAGGAVGVLPETGHKLTGSEIWVQLQRAI